MEFIPETKIGIKTDPFYHLKKYFLKIWVQHKKLLIPCYIALILKYFGFITRTIFIFNSVKNPDVILEISATYPIPLLAVLKMTFLLIHKKKVRMLFDTVTSKFWQLSLANPGLEAYWQKRFFFINLLLLSHFSMSTGYVVMHLAFPYVPIPEGRTRWLPTLISVPFNTDRSPLYEILYLVLSWNMFVSVLGNGVFDLLFVYFIQHLVAQFNILSDILEKIDLGVMSELSDLEKFKSEKFQWKIFCRIAICIKHHNLLMRYGEELQYLASIIFGIQLLTTLLTLVLTGFTVTQNLDELSKSTMLLSFVLSSIMQFSIFAVQCSDISEQSASVAYAAYQTNWYLFNAKTKRGLTLLIMNSQKGINIYAAGLVRMDNEVIVKMGQKVFSFITLLRSLNEPPE